MEFSDRNSRVSRSNDNVRIRIPPSRSNHNAAQSRSNQNASRPNQNASRPNQNDPPSFPSNSNEVDGPEILPGIKMAWWFLVSTLLTYFGLLYTPLIGIIQMKFLNKQVFDTHGTYIYIALACLFLSGFGTGYMILALRGGTESVIDSPRVYEYAASLVIVCAVIAPLSLFLTAIFDDEKQITLGYYIIVGVACCILLYIFRRYLGKLRDYVFSIHTHNDD